MHKIIHTYKSMIPRLILHSSLIITLCLSCTLSYAELLTNNFFPFGVFDKSDPYGKFDNIKFEAGSDEWKKYRNNFTEMLVRYNINTVVNTPYKNESHAKYTLDTLYKHNIKVIFQPGNPFNRKNNITNPGDHPDSVYKHPAIIAYKLWDEPKTEEKLRKLKNWYELIRNHYTKPIVTALIGEAMNLDATTHSLNVKQKTDISTRAWDMLNSEILFTRYYPFRRQYDLLNWYKEKMTMPMPKWCEHMETVSASKPWWYIPQLFGKGKDKSKSSYWRLPTANEINSSVHIALAYGARGIIGWGIPTYDYNRKPTRKMFIDQNLRPETARDGSIPMEQYGSIGKLIKNHSNLLLNHIRSDFEVITNNDETIAVPREDPADKILYIYTVNMNTESSNPVSVTIPSSLKITSAHDIYTGKPVTIEQSGSKTTLTYTLTPGEAFFIQLVR